MTVNNKSAKECHGNVAKFHNEIQQSLLYWCFMDFSRLYKFGKDQNLNNCTPKQWTITLQKAMINNLVKVKQKVHHPRQIVYYTIALLTTTNQREYK